MRGGASGAEISDVRLCRKLRVLYEGAAPAAESDLMNAELLSLYEADRREHARAPRANTPAYRAMRARDLERRVRVMELVAAGGLSAPEDYYHAAWIMNHGDTPADARSGHLLALRSSELGHRPARWLAAASYDRWQMYQGKPQKYGTNYVYDGRRDRLWDVDPRTTDEERAAWDVPPLAEQLRKAEEANSGRAPLSEEEMEEFKENAPGWLREVLEKWGREEGHPDEAAP